MHPRAERKVRRLTKNQAKALKAITFAPINISNSGVPGIYISTASGLRGNELGGTVSALERNDLIEPLGRTGRQFNWELADSDLIKAKNEDSRTLLNLLEKISGEKK